MYFSIAAFFNDLLICQNSLLQLLYAPENISQNGIFTAYFRSSLLQSFVTLIPCMFCLQDEGWLMGILELSGIKGVFPANFTKRI